MSRAVNASIDISRSPLEVFDYVSDPERLPEWQPDVEAAAFDLAGRPPSVGMQGHEARKVPGGTRTIRWEVCGCDPGVRWAVRGINGPLRAHVDLGLTPLAQGTRTRVDYAISFEAHGIGKILSPLVRRGVRHGIADTLVLLKQSVEEQRR